MTATQHLDTIMVPGAATEFTSPVDSPVPDGRARGDYGGQSSMSDRRKRIPPVAAWASPPASSPVAGDASAAHAVA
jgi:hypothetical protein